MRRCKHENAVPHVWNARKDRWEEAAWCPRRHADCLACLDCGAWLSLGAANDDSEAVRIEARAAEIVPRRDLLSFDQTLAIREAHGWWDCGSGDYGPPDYSGAVHPEKALADWLAGYLARCIVETEST